MEKKNLQTDTKKSQKIRALQAKKMEEISEIWQGFGEENAEIPSDVLGSYRGTGENGAKTPTQDADDL